MSPIWVLLDALEARILVQSVVQVVSTCYQRQLAVAASSDQARAAHRRKLCASGTGGWRCPREPQLGMVGVRSPQGLVRPRGTPPKWHSFPVHNGREIMDECIDVHTCVHECNECLHENKITGVKNAITWCYIHVLVHALGAGHALSKLHKVPRGLLADRKYI